MHLMNLMRLNLDFKILYLTNTIEHNQAVVMIRRVAEVPQQ